MGVLGNALKALLAACQQGPAGGRASLEAPPRPLTALYQLFRARGFPVLGEPDTAFAIYDQEKGVVRVYATDQKQVDIVPYESLLPDVLRDVQAAGGSFTVCGEDVLCVLSGVVARGSSYGDAAIRALSLLSQVQTPPLPADPLLKPGN